MEIDIRSLRKEEIDVIRFADSKDHSNCANQILKSPCVQKAVWLANNRYNPDECGIVIEGKENAKNLIKALEKAIELGWFE